jgi:hypothetical protein
VTWFLDPNRTEYNTPLAAHRRAHYQAAPTPRIVIHDLFGQGRIVGPSSDYFDGLGRLAHCVFFELFHGQMIEGSFSRESITVTAAPEAVAAPAPSEPRTLDTLVAGLAEMAEVSA